MIRINLINLPIHNMQGASTKDKEREQYIVKKAIQSFNDDNDDKIGNEMGRETSKANKLFPKVKMLY